MSIRSFLGDFVNEVAFNPYANDISDRQRRGWLKRALAQVNDKRSLRDQIASVEVVANSQFVAFPFDYIFASQEALLAVEYATSRNYVANLGYDTSPFGVGGISAPTKAHFQAVKPKPVVVNQQEYGRTRKALRLTFNPTSSRTELLMYNALYQINDPYTEIIIVTNPTTSETVAITGNNVVIYSFVVGSPTGNQVKIGTSTYQTTVNLTTKINSNTATSGLKAIQEGQTIKLFGDKTDVDTAVVVDGVKLIAAQFDSVNSLDSRISSIVYKWLEAEYYNYLLTDLSQPITDPGLRRLHKEKADSLFNQALNDLQKLT